MCVFITSPILAKTMTVLVYPFENTGDKKYSWISTGLTDSVISDFAKINDVNVISDQDRKTAMKELEFARSGMVDESTIAELGKITGANIILTGSYQVIGEKIRVNAKLMNVETSKIENSIKLDGTIDTIFDLEDKIVIGLLKETNKMNIADVKPIIIKDDILKKIEDKPTSNVSAYEFYSKGREVQDTNPVEALNFFRKALAIDPNYTSALTEAGFTAGNTLNYFSEAIDYLNRADSIFKKKGEANNEEYSNLLLTLGVLYWKMGELDKALSVDRQSKVLKEKLGLVNTLDYAILTMNTGLVYWSKGMLDQSLDFYNKAKNTMDSLGENNTSTYSLLMMNTGLIYWNRGELDTALEYFEKSKKIKDDLNLQNTTGYALLMLNMGLIYYEKNDYDQAMDYYLKDKSISESLGLQKTHDYSLVLNNIALIYWGRNDFTTALKFYNQAKQTEESLNLQNTGFYSMLLMNMGLIYDSQKDLDKALDYYQKSKNVRDKLGLQNTKDYGSLLYNFARIYEMQGKADQAGEFYRKAYNAYSSAGYSGPWLNYSLENAERLGH